MKMLLSSVVWRYVAIALQFCVVILVAHRTSIDTAGKYFAIFGFVTVASVGVGFGLPDGLVRYLPALRRSAQPQRVRELLWKGTFASIGISIASGLAGYLIASPFVDFDSTVIVLATTWWFGYALTFLFAQALVALGRPVVGAFVAYSSISIGYMLTLIPFALTTREASLHGLLYAANMGTWLAAFAGCGLVLYRTTDKSINQAQPELRAPSDKESDPTVTAMIATGFPMMLGRFIQASLPWIPVWVLITLVSAEQAAIYAAASRLVVAVTSVVAALRFSVRPMIVQLDLEERYEEIARLNRRCSLIAAVPPLAGIVFLALIGEQVIPFFLGRDYANVNAVLIVLMLGVLAEAFGGMSDEILKMTGRTKVVLISLVIAVIAQTLLTVILGKHGASVVAFATVAAFAIEYVGQVIWLSTKTPIEILPLRSRAQRPVRSRQ